jgi:Na+/melibiose symporter-like transporter
MTYFLKPTLEYPIGQMNRTGYMYLGYSTSIVMIIVGLITYFTTKEYIPYLNSKIHSDHKNKKTSILEQFKLDFVELSTNKNYQFVALAYLSANLASAIIGSIGLHVFTYTFRLDSSAIGIVLGTLFVFMILSQPFWVKYSRLKDKRNAAILATKIGLFSCLFFLLAVILKGYVVHYPYALLPFSILAGFSVGGLLTLPLSMVGDTIDIEELNTGRRSEGLYYGGLTFSYKSSQAIAIFVVGILLDLSGFNPDFAVQSPTTEVVLGLILALGSVFAFGLTLYAYNRYNLSQKTILEVRTKLKEKQNGKNNAG